MFYFIAHIPTKLKSALQNVIFTNKIVKTREVFSEIALQQNFKRF